MWPAFVLFRLILAVSMFVGFHGDLLYQPHRVDSKDAYKDQILKGRMDVNNKRRFPYAFFLIISIHCYAISQWLYGIALQPIELQLSQPGASGFPSQAQLAFSIDEALGGILSPIPLHELIAVITFVLGIYIRIRSRVELGRFFTYQVAIRQQHELIETGLYSILIHPGYCGSILMIIPMTVFLSQWYFTILIIGVSFTFLLFRIKNEEEVLEKEFGQAWKNRVKKVARLIPYIF